MRTGGLRVLVVGGYGGFGRRLVELLPGTNVDRILVGGRSLERATAFCDSRKETLEPVELDRSACCRAALEAAAPDIVIDAAGPFQCYGDRPYSLIETCIDLGINYMDLADAREFVGGVDRFDARARTHGVFVLSGASSVPALSGAAIEALMAQVNTAERIDIGITPAGGVSMGLNVVRAILSYAGRAVDVRESGGSHKRWCWTDLRCKRLVLGGQDRLNRRLFSLCDVPDLALWPARYPNLKTVYFGAALEPAILHLGMVAVAWLVRLKLLPRPLALAAMLHRAARWMPAGVKCGGMFVRVTGRDGNDRKAAAEWVLIVDGDHGPYIPAMAAAAVVARMADGWCPEPGARACTSELELSHFAAQFSKFDIRTGIRRIDDRDLDHG